MCQRIWSWGTSSWSMPSKELSCNLAICWRKSFRACRWSHAKKRPEMRGISSSWLCSCCKGLPTLSLALFVAAVCFACIETTAWSSCEVSSFTTLIFVKLQKLLQFGVRCYSWHFRITPSSTGPLQVFQVAEMDSSVLKWWYDAITVSHRKHWDSAFESLWPINRCMQEEVGTSTTKPKPSETRILSMLS